MIITLLLAACGNPMPTMVPTVTESPTLPSIATAPAVATSTTASYPSPVVVNPVPTTSAYPGPGTPGTGTAIIPASGYEPQPGDDKLTRGEVTLDLSAARLNSSGTSPNEVTVTLKGSMPDPCHQLRMTLTSADAQNNISLQVYSVFDKTKACTTVIQPFQVTYPLGSFSDGHYSVYINDQLVGEFDG